MLIAGNCCADESDGDLLSGGNIRRPADNLERLLSHRNTAHGKPVGFGVPLDVQDFSDDETLVLVARPLHGFKLKPDHCQAFGDLFRRQPDVRVLLQPTLNDMHRSELVEESNIVFEKEADVIDAVPQERNPFDAHPERKAGISFRVVSH